MISLVNNKNELSFLPADPYSARITALAETYGTEHNFAIFWVQKIDEIPVAPISSVDGNMTLCCGENADFEELSGFVNVAGYSTLTFDMALAEKLGIVPQKSSFAVKYTGGAESYDVLS